MKSLLQATNIYVDHKTHCLTTSRLHYPHSTTTKNLHLGIHFQSSHKSLARVGMVWSFSDTIWGSIMRILHQFLIPFVPICHARTFLPRWNCPNISMVWNGFASTNDNPHIQRYSHLDKPIKYQYLIGLPILIPT